MAIEITMPQLSDTMDKGTILSWRKKEGDKVSRGDALAEVATDKADLEIESFHEGVLLKIHTPEGTTVQVGQIIALIGEKGEQPVASAPKAAAPQPVVQVVTPQAPPVAVQPPVVQAKQEIDLSQHTNGSDGRIKISPLAKNFASAHGVDYTKLEGSGDGGRIVKKDVEGAMSNVPAQQAFVNTPEAPKYEAPKATTSAAGAQPLTKMRSAIAAQMVKSVTEIPHFYVTSRIEVDALSKVRESLKPLPQYEGITFTHMLIKACGLALKKVPRINSCFRDGSLIEHNDINVGIITALPDGLLIPVLKGADISTLADVVSDSKALVQRARSGRPKPEDLVGGTFAISNMGRFDVESFTAIINPNHGAILAVSGIQAEPVVKGEVIVPGNVMRVTLSCDHRIIDGLMAGEFLTELKRLIEDPILLLA